MSAVRLVQADPSPSPLARLYAPVAEHLVRVEEILRAEMRNPHPFVDELVRYGAMLGGKRLRPALLLLTAQATGAVESVHHVLGATLEMIHTATLVHDDVLDEAKTRRHLATVNARWDDEASVLLGDYLFSHAFYLASTTGHAEACRVIGRATNIVCEGEIRQKGTRGDFDLDEAAYYAIVDGKTAELTACACWLGARYAGADEPTVAAMEKYGRDLGVAFQIADDLLDLLGAEHETGKSLGTDLEKRKPTLPVIHLLGALSPRERQEVVELLQADSASRLSDLRRLLERHGSFDYARERAESFARSAREIALQLAPNTSSRTLAELPDFVVSRST